MCSSLSLSSTLSSSSVQPQTSRAKYSKVIVMNSCDDHSLFTSSLVIFITGIVFVLLPLRSILHIIILIVIHLSFLFWLFFIFPKLSSSSSSSLCHPPQITYKKSFVDTKIQIHGRLLFVEEEYLRKNDASTANI